VGFAAPAAATHVCREGAIKMHKRDSRSIGYALVGVLGAIGGGLVVAVATKAIPKMMPQIMEGMMRKMMAHMGEGG
jgi:uncharacterized membrane protein YeiH